MSFKTNEPKPAWTDPAATAVTPTTGAAAVTPVAPVTPLGPAAVIPPKKSGGWMNLLLGLAAVIAVGGVAFAIGRSTAPASAASIGTVGNPNGGFVLTPGGSFDPNPNGGPTVRGFFGSGGPTIDGTVESISGDSMTVKLASGDTVTVKLDSSTTYHQSTAATSSDVTAGDSVAVRINGGSFRGNGNGNGPALGGPNASAGTTTRGTARDLTASDVTVSR
jgi:hypothetical protein